MSAQIQSLDAAVSLTAAPPRHPWKEICAASIGNALEFYDLLIYGYFAVVIGKLFFPVENETTSLLLSVGTFGISFVMRPLGAIVLGSYADRAGRKPSLTLSISIMMLGTAMIAFARAPQIGSSRENGTGKPRRPVCGHSCSAPRWQMYSTIRCRSRGELICSI